MVKWKLLTEENARLIWDENLVRFADCSPFQMYDWGQYNRALGWQPYYFAAFDEKGDIAAMCLGLLRRFSFGIGILWCVGGPIGDIQHWNEDLQKTVVQAANLKRLYFRFRCDREREAKDALFLNNCGWTRSLFMMTSGLSIEIDLSKTEQERHAELSRRWRRNLKFSQNGDLVIKQCSNPDIEELHQVFTEMETRKNLPQLFSHEKLENLFRHVNGNLLLLRCETAEGELLCFRGGLIIGNRACDYLAATTELGLETRASYATLWQLLEQCREQGVTNYDLGGIDPWANPGVYTFKKETGAREVEFLGEWDRATSGWLRLLGNWAIQRRQNAKPVPDESSSDGSNWNKKVALRTNTGERYKNQQIITEN